jgi:methionine salvage enolase-phosphatase E1
MTNKEKLFAEVYEACPEAEGDGNVQHLLRAAEARGVRMWIYSSGVMEYHNLKSSYGGELDFDITKSLSDQSDEVLNKLAEIIL